MSADAVSGAPGLSGAALLPEQPLLFERSVAGRTGVQLPKLDVPRAEVLPEELRRAELPLPELSEPEVVRHSPTPRAATSPWTRASIRSAPAP